jgi:hypothetical protein
MNSPSALFRVRNSSIESIKSQENNGELLIMLLKENLSLKKKNKELNYKMNLYEQIIFDE